MKENEISTEAYGGSTFIWRNNRFLGCITKLADCVSIHVGPKYVTIPIEVWDMMRGA